ncbi:helix-hairpin-helix domain-containing protein [Micromonospora sp. NPDC048830]|uniref:helix-hairpin-helix domain-containing protein n=1 Tax=Micromonospora sp. NPDC048830 TaxID=3364257 RepID=UPI003711AABC
MPSTFGQWLFAILALLVGLAAGWVLRGRQDAQASIVERAPAAGATGVSDAPVEATIDVQPPAATVAATTTEAVVDEPAPDTAEPTRPGAVLADSDQAAFAPEDTAPMPADTREPAGAAAEPTGDDRKAAPAAAPAAGPTGDDRKAELSAPAPRAAADDADLPETGDREPAEAPLATLPSGDAATPADVIRADVNPADVDPADVIRADVDPADANPDAVGTDAPTAAVDADAKPDATPAVADEAKVPAAPVPAASGGTGEPGAGATEAAGAAASTDDFRRIQGIGPKMAAALHDAGIRTYRQLADLDEAALRETIRAAGLRAAPSLATWPQQARVLAGAPGEAERVLPVAVGDA